MTWGVRRYSESRRLRVAIQGWAVGDDFIEFGDDFAETGWTEILRRVRLNVVDRCDEWGAEVLKD